MAFVRDQCCAVCSGKTYHVNGECWDCMKRKEVEWEHTWEHEMTLEEKVEYLYKQLNNLKDHSVFRGRLG
jgi:hypothetical protein